MSAAPSPARAISTALRVSASACPSSSASTTCVTLGLVRYGRGQRNLLTGLVWLFDGVVAVLLLIGLGLGLSGTIALINHLAGQEFIAQRRESVATINQKMRNTRTIRRASFLAATRAQLSTRPPVRRVAASGWISWQRAAQSRRPPARLAASPRHRSHVPTL